MAILDYYKQYPRRGELQAEVQGRKGQARRYLQKVRGIEHYWEKDKWS